MCVSKGKDQRTMDVDATMVSWLGSRIFFLGGFSPEQNFYVDKRKILLTSASSPKKHLSWPIRDSEKFQTRIPSSFNLSSTDSIEQIQTWVRFKLLNGKCGVWCPQIRE